MADVKETLLTAEGLKKLEEELAYYKSVRRIEVSERIKTANREILALDNLRKEKAEYYDMHFSSMNNEEAQKYLEELAQIDEQIMNLASDVEEFKNKIMELRWKPFDDLQNDLSNLITEYQNAQKWRFR